MKRTTNYILSIMLMLFFACSVMGIKAEASLQQVTGIKQTGADPTTVELEWNAVLGSGVDYQIDISEDGQNWGELDKDSNGGQARVELGGLSSGTTYYVRILAFKEEYNGDTEETTRIESSAYSEIFECVTTPSDDPEYLHKTKSTTTSISVEWAAVDGANAYIVTYTPIDNSTGELKTVVTDTKVTIKNLHKNTQYTVGIYPARQTSTGSYIASEGGGGISEIGFGVTPTKVTRVRVEAHWDTKVDMVCDVLASANSYEAELWTAYQKRDKKLDSAECDYSPQLTGITTTYLESEELSQYRFFKVRMRGFSANTDGSKSYGEWSDWKYLCRQPEITKIKASKSGMKLTWDTIKGADRYVVYASLKKKTGYKKVATTKKTTYTVKKFNKKKLKKGKTYYFYVVAENKVGKKYFSGETLEAKLRWSEKYKY